MAPMWGSTGMGASLRLMLSHVLCSSDEHEHSDRALELPDSGARLSRELPRARFGEVLASPSKLLAGLPAKTFCFHVA